MSKDLTDYAQDQDAKESRDTLMLLGGAALLIFGAGLILSTPYVRGLVGGINIGNLVSSALPKDVERYMRMRSM